MPESEIICLANSKKHGGRCVVGLRTDGEGWVRPVSSKPDGALYPEHFILDDGTEAQIFDVIKIPVASHRPQPHQPENYLIEEKPWDLVARPATEERLRTMLYFMDHGPDIFGDQSEKISYDSICDSNIEESVTLVSPKNLRWSVTGSAGGRRQTRAVFRLGKAQYSLPVTDPLWEERLGGLPQGSHRFTKAGLRITDKVLLTISLGEPFDDGCCYKLVAAVIVLPDYIRANF